MTRYDYSFFVWPAETWGFDRSMFKLFEALGISQDKAEDAVNKVLDAEVALRELAAQFQHPH